MVTLSCAQNVLARNSVKCQDIAIAARRVSAVLLLTPGPWIGPQHNMAAAAGDEMVLPLERVSYVREDIPCKHASPNCKHTSNATLTLLPRDGFGYARSFLRFRATALTIAPTRETRPNLLPVVKAGKYQAVLASCYRSEMA